MSALTIFSISLIYNGLSIVRVLLFFLLMLLLWGLFICNYPAWIFGLLSFIIFRKISIFILQIFLLLCSLSSTCMVPDILSSVSHHR